MNRLRVALCLAVTAGCSAQDTRDAAVVDAPPAAPRALDAAPSVAPVVAPAPVAPASPPRRWIAGDLHMHTAPPGWRHDVRLTIPQIAAACRARGLEFVIVTPHLWETTWTVAKRRRAWMVEWRAMAAEARAQSGVTMIPGVEWGLDGVGHFGVSGAALPDFTGDDFLADAHAAGAFIVANHPFAVPTRHAGHPDSFRDLSYTPWTHGDRVVRHDPLDGVEVFNQMLSHARLVSEHQQAKGYLVADAMARADHRPIALVGGTDNHRHYVKPTTWVLATDASEAAILAGLHAGATCVGGPEAGTLEAHGDADPPDRWAVIGESARATSILQLRWQGRAHLFVDGVDRGWFDGHWTDEAAASVHTYRIELGASRCGFVYANL